MSATSVGTNWAGNIAYSARALHHPQTIDEVRRIVAGAARARALGSRHSFTTIADSEELISLGELRTEITVDAAAGEATVPAGTTYAQLAAVLEPHRLALPNLASLPHISVAGAVATATHGSGNRLGNLATAVSGLELVTGDVSLGLAIVSATTIRTNRPSVPIRSFSDPAMARCCRSASNSCA